MQFLRRERNWPLVTLAIGVAILLPRLGSYGFWEPTEIQVADAARARLEKYTLEEVERAVTTHYRVRLSDIKNTEPVEAAEPGAPGYELGLARDMIVYLARKYTHESTYELERALHLKNLAPSLKRIRTGLDSASDNSRIANDLASIQKKLEERAEKDEDSRKGRRRGGQVQRPDFTLWAVSQGLDKLSRDELGTRLPLALLGLIALMATFYLGRRLASPRAGLLAAVVLATMPLFLFQSRQLNSDIGAVTGTSLMMLGLLGIAWPRADRLRRHAWLYLVDLALIGVGATMSYYAAGALLGLLPPLLAVALACIVALIADRGSGAFAPGRLDGLSAEEVRKRRASRGLHLAIVGALATVAAITVLLVVFFAIFDLTDPIPGGRELFGKSVVAETGYVAALGGAWRPTGDLNVTFDSLFQQIAFGIFLWSALAPIALLHVTMGARRGRRSWAGYALFGWALITWVVAAVMTRKVGPVHYPALVAIAVAIGMWLDDLLAARAHAEEAPKDDTRKRFGLLPRLPLVALFAALAAIVLAKDLDVFPEKITSIQILGSTVQYPKGMALKAAFVVFAALFGVAIGLGLWRWRPRADRPTGVRAVLYHAGRGGLRAALVIAVLFAFFLAQWWTPALSRKLSSKHLFSVYHEYKSKGDRLGIMGMGPRETGPKYYAGDSYETLANRNELLQFLKADGRAFALVPASELCAVNRAAKGEFDYAVLDDSHARFLLLSNQLKPGERDRNPLVHSILRKPPTNIDRALDVNFDNKIQLIGVNMPRRVGRGDSFEMTLFFKVLKPVGGTWKIFVHFDGGGLRFQADHDPINGRCGTGFWQPGDYIVDRFTVEAGDMTYAKTAYTARVGFFVGSHGNWRNMKVVEGEHDSNDRVTVGSIRLK